MEKPKEKKKGRDTEAQEKMTAILSSKGGGDFHRVRGILPLSKNERPGPRSKGRGGHLFECGEPPEGRDIGKSNMGKSGLSWDTRLVFSPARNGRGRGAIRST